MRRACMAEIYRLARRDRRVVFVGSDIGAGTLDEFKKEMPDRFFMEGVSEAFLIGMMAGLALSGKIPYLNTIATFLTRRCFEQVMIDAGLHNANVRLVGSGGGATYAPLGPTHLALEDIAIMRAVPHMTVVAPADAEEMKRLIPQTLDHRGPIYIRMAKGGDPVVSRPALGFRIGQAIRLREGRDACLVSTGVTTKRALDAAELLAREGIQTAVLHVHTLKPFDHKTFLETVEPVRAVVTLEEHFIHGGLGSMAAEVLSEANLASAKKFKRLGFPDGFVHRYGSQDFLMDHYGITAGTAAQTIRELVA